MSRASDVVIDIARPACQARALWMLFFDQPPQERSAQVAATLAGTTEGRLSLEGLFTAHRGERLVGSIWGQVIPGKVGVIWPAQLVDREAESTAELLHQAVRRHFEAAGVCVVQASIATIDRSSVERLKVAGFTYLADVLYLAAGLDRVVENASSSPLEFETYDEAKYQRLAEIVQRTYEDTHDCPALNGVRSIDDVLLGYRHTGVFCPDRWLIVRHNGRDAGCLLLADHAEQDQWELVYMGLCPEARGNGWGRNIARHALCLAAAANRQRLVLAVDAQNQPALAMYESVGFAAWERRSVYIQAIRRHSAPPRQPA